MKTLGILALAPCALALFAGCGVGPYHTPMVEPVVMPEPEEDIFADLDMSGGSDAPKEAAPAEPPAPAPEAAPAAAPASEPAASPAAPAAPAAAPKKTKKK